MTFRLWLLLLFCLPEAPLQSCAVDESLQRVTDDGTALLQVRIGTLTGAGRASNLHKAESKEDADQEVAKVDDKTAPSVHARLSGSKVSRSTTKGDSASMEHDAQTPEGWDWEASLEGSLSTGHSVQSAQPVQLAGATVAEEKFALLPSSLQVLDVVNGTGKGASKGQRVWVHYVASLDDGIQFDSSFDGDPMEVVVGNGDVVEGFDESLINMRQGGKRKVIIPPSLGYGSEPPPKSHIPPNANLHFTIEMIGIDPGNDQGIDNEAPAPASRLAPEAPESAYAPGTPEAALAKVPSKAEATERFTNAVMNLYHPNTLSSSESSRQRRAGKAGHEEANMDNVNKTQRSEDNKTASFAKWLRPRIPLSEYGAVSPSRNESVRFAEEPDQVEHYLKWKMGVKEGDCSQFECNEEFCNSMMSVLGNHGFNARVALAEDTLLRESDGWHPYGEPFPYSPSEWPRSLSSEYDDMKTGDFAEDEFAKCVEDYVTQPGLKPGTWPDKEQLANLAEQAITGNAVMPASMRCMRLRSRKKNSSEQWSQSEACASCECYDFDQLPHRLQFTPY